MKINDALAGLLLAVFAAAVYAICAALPAMAQQIGPGLFPQLLAGGLLVCALLLVRKGLCQRRADGRGRAGGWIEWPAWAGERRAVYGFALVPLALLFYIFASEPLGFLPTAMVLLLALFMAFGARLRVAVLLAPAGALGIHAIFYKLLKVPLPWGVLQPLAW